MTVIRITVWMLDLKTVDFCQTLECKPISMKYSVSYPDHVPNLEILNMQIYRKTLNWRAIEAKS